MRQLLIAILLILCNFSESKATAFRSVKLKSKAEKLYHSRRQTAWTQCSNQPQSDTTQRSFGRDVPGGTDLGPLGGNRGRRAASNGNSYSQDKAIFLSSSRGQLIRGEDRVPEHVFTVAFWCRPEGGQEASSVILEAKDLCLPFPESGWCLGIRTPDPSGERDLRFYLSLHSWSKMTGSNVTSPLPLVSGKWSHVAVVYDGKTAILFINGAQVALIRDQSSHPAQSPACRALWLGGDIRSHFRGRLDDFRMWNSALTQHHIREIMTRKIPPTSIPRSALSDDFTSLDGWEWNGGRHGSGNEVKYNPPLLVNTDIPTTGDLLQPKPNPCGFTICDSPEVTGNYRDLWMLRKPKVLRYRVIVVSEDDGSNPTVTKDQIRAQHEFLQSAYSPYNFTWELDEVVVKNTSLRRRWTLLSCDATMVGNGQCEPECRHPATGNDGGDCGRSRPTGRQNHLHYDYQDEEDEMCSPDMMGNGVCDAQCNVALHRWDGDDCCAGEGFVDSCYDPNSPNRSYMDVQELKTMLQLKNSRHINVLFAHWTNRDIMGVATFPWEKNLFTEQGGVVLQPSSYGREGQMSTLVHELGHALGLWHVHHGVSEVGCGHQCHEREPTILAGDLCSDTRPTPENLHCHDPPPGATAFCGRSHFVGTPFNNYMGYADDSCVQEFTPEQVARMHCYVDLVYASVQNKGRDNLPPPPLAPNVFSATSKTVTISWTPTLAGSAFYDTNICSFCSETLELSQYGYRAESNGDVRIPDGAWTPGQATGPPDAEPCVPSYKAWLPDLKSCPNEVCTLTIHFQTPTVPSLLLLWVTWNSHQGLQEVEMVFTDGSMDLITHLPAQCDAPLSIPLFYDKAVNKMHIRTANRFVSVDAVRLVSVPNNPQCSPCKPLRYRVARDPPFDTTGNTKDADDPIFTDTNLQPDQQYSYQVQAWLGSRVTDFSPALIYVHGSPVCGDGVVDKNEACDDGGILDGDGCSASCEVEDTFHCNGQPSLCYWFEGDGHCEDFESRSSLSDCGFFTPKGFTDQWAEAVQAGPGELGTTCPPNMVIGPPVLPISCRNEPNPLTSWVPCDVWTETKFWLSATFRRPAVATSVLLYLVADGISNRLSQGPSMTALQLLDSKGIPHHEQHLPLVCSKAPQEISIVRDLSMPFMKTYAVNLTFTTSDIAIAAIRLRSSDVLNPVEVGECTAGQLYHPGLQKCDKYCHLPSCTPLPAKHAQLNCSGQQEGDVCTVVCDPGHRRTEGQPPLVCVGGEWRGPDPNCKPVDCGLPLLAHADAICPDGTTYTKACNYKCRPPARFIGGGNGLVKLVCEASGQWSQPGLVCQLSCPAPSPPAHTVLASPRCRKAEVFVFGQACRFRCKVGYHVRGFNMRKRILYLRCDSTASWSGPQCIPVTCPDPGTLHHNCTAGNAVGSECTVRCPTTTTFQVVSVSVHRCELDGAWTPVLPRCQSVCPSPEAEDYNVHLICDGNHIGALCKTTCRDADMQPTTSLIAAEKIKIKCETNGKWLPNPHEIVCKKKCKEIYIADGYCDETNNQLHCQWDGGDCCSSTALSNTVKPFPLDCGEPCSCMDPNAVENLDSFD